MATWYHDPAIDPGQRIVNITSVAAGDLLDFHVILGRPAKGFKLVATSTSDTLSYRLNNLTRIKTHKKVGSFDSVVAPINFLNKQHTAFTETGSLEYTSQDSFQIDNIEITALSLSTGTTISVVAW